MKSTLETTSNFLNSVVNSKTQTTTPSYIPNDKTSVASNILPALSESLRKFTEGGFKGLFSKEPAPTWKEAFKQKLADLEQANRMKGKIVVDGELREINAFNPLTVLSTEPLLNVGKIALTSAFKKIAGTTKVSEIVDSLKSITKGSDDDISKMAIKLKDIAD